MTEFALPKSACMVVFDYEQGLEIPMGWDKECEGALCYGEPVVIFPNRKAAQNAIRISRAYAKLQHAQGGNENTDWMPDCSQFIKIRKVVASQ